MQISGTFLFVFNSYSQLMTVNVLGYYCTAWEGIKEAIIIRLILP